KSSAQEKEEASHLSIGKRHNETFTIKAESESEPEQTKKAEPVKQALKVEEKKEIKPEVEKVSNEAPRLQGIRVVGKIDLDAKGRPEAKAEEPPAVKEEPKQEEKPLEQEAPKAVTVEKT